MIRAYCTVCQDSIVHVIAQGQQEVATGPCGHAFHHECLTRWLNQKRSCPKCRQKISKPIVLFLDEEEQGNISKSEEDVSVLRSQLEHLKEIVKQKDDEKTNLSTQKRKIQESLDSMKEKCTNAEKRLTAEKTFNAGLKKQMAYLKKQEVETAEARQEATSCREELQRFKRLQQLVAGTKDDAEAMLTSLRDNGRASPEMITQLIILKKELEKIRVSRNKARENKEVYEREINKMKHELSAKEIDIRKVTEQLNLTESDLMRIEKENASLKKKMSKLEQAFNSPSPRSSAIARLMRESPAPMEFKRPRLTPPEEIEDDYIQGSYCRGDKDNELETAAKEMGLHIVKTTTFNSNPIHNNLQRPPLKMIQARKRPADFDACSSVIKKGYDGMGGHTKFLKPSKVLKARKVARPSTISKFVKMTKDGKEPPLPTMTLDFDI